MDSTTVWTTVWPLWPLQHEGDASMAAGYEPPLLWLRHDRTPLAQEVKVLLNGTVLYQSLRTGAKHASADKPLVMAAGCNRRLSTQASDQLETLEFRELPGYSGHTVMGDETTDVLHKTIDNLLERGEKLDSLVERSDDLSKQSKMFYKQARKTNSCCVVS